MSFLFGDSFSSYSNANQLGIRWDDVQMGSQAMSTGRDAGGLALGMRYSYNHAAKLIPSPQTIIVGFAVKIVDTTTKYMPLVTLLDGATGQFILYLGASNELRAARITGVDVTGRYIYTDLGQTENGVLRMNAWQYVELKVKVDNSAGTVVVRVGEVVKLSLTGQDTQTSANAYATWVMLDNRPFNVSQRYERDIDDFYICNTAGSINNDFLGDIWVKPRVPNATGNYTQWTTVYGDANHWGAVDDAGLHDSDATYIASATTNHIDTFACTSLPISTGTVAAVQVVLAARKDDAGARSLISTARVGTTDATGPVAVALTDTYQHHCFVHETAPSGSGWTTATVNSAEFGAKVTS